MFGKEGKDWVFLVRKATNDNLLLNTSRETRVKALQLLDQLLAKLKEENIRQTKFINELVENSEAWLASIKP